MTTVSDGWRLYVAYLRGSYRVLLLSLPISVGQMLTIIPIAAVVRHAFDAIVPAGDVLALALAGLLILALYLANLALTLWSRHLVLTATKRAIGDLRLDLLRCCYERPWASFREENTGRLHAAIVQDTERVDVMTVALVGVLLPELLVVGALCVALVRIDPTLFAALVAVVPVLVLVSRYLTWQAREQAASFRRSFERFSAGIAFALRAMELSRIQGAEQQELERQRAHVDDLRVTSGRMAWRFTLQTSVQYAVLAASGVLILVVGGRGVASDAISLGQLLSFSVATALLVKHLGAAMGAVPQVIVGRESLLRLAEILLEGDETPPAGLAVGPFRGNVAVRGVWFQYGERPLLRGVDLELRPGTTTALTGLNGAGKTTLIQLILGLQRPDRGELYADGRAYGELDLVGLRRCIGVVPQEPLIVDGTVLENVCYGSPGADRDAAIEAARLALADDFIRELPSGVDTPVGEEGVRLSGGQRQRIAIARALVRRPALLILDEPGNHLDRPTVRRMLEHLRRVTPAPAILFVTHDEEIMARCDVVCRLDDGSIVAGVPALTARAAEVAGPGIR